MLVTKQLRQAMKKKDMTIIADKGYIGRNDIKASHNLGIITNTL
jgi:hypothetical protein